MGDPGLRCIICQGKFGQVVTEGRCGLCLYLYRFQSLVLSPQFPACGGPILEPEVRQLYIPEGPGRGGYLQKVLSGSARHSGGGSRWAPAEVPPVLRELSAKSKAKPPAAAETEEKEEPVVPKVEKEEPNYSPDKSPEKPVPEEEEPRGKEKKSKPSSSQEKTRARSSGIHRSRRRERRSRSRSRKRRRSSTRRGGSKHRSPTGGSVEQGRFRGVTEGRTGLRCLGGPLWGQEAPRDRHHRGLRKGVGKVLSRPIPIGDTTGVGTTAGRSLRIRAWKRGSNRPYLQSLRRGARGRTVEGLNVT